MTTIVAAIDQPDRNRSSQTDAGTLHGAETPLAGPSKKAIWSGRTLSGLAVLFLAFDAAMKVFEVPVAVEGTLELGYAASTLLGIGVLQIACLVVYLIPRTSVFGAVLWTGYLGGAVATHVRVGSPLFSHMLFPIYIAALLWLGLWLRDLRLRAVLPLHAAR